MSTEPTRRYEIEQSAPWDRRNQTILRVYGQGVCTIGEGVPKFYQSLDGAQEAGDVWIRHGVAPADRR